MERDRYRDWWMDIYGERWIKRLVDEYIYRERWIEIGGWIARWI